MHFPYHTMSQRTLCDDIGRPLVISPTLIPLRSILDAKSLPLEGRDLPSLVAISRDCLRYTEYFELLISVTIS
jgi:hypothetical protein